MRGRETRRLAVGAATFLAAVGLALATPSQPQAASAGCGENSGPVCWANESCVDILFYEQCTTEYRYYARPPTGGSGGGGTGPDRALDDVNLPDVSGGCEWGADFVGWGGC